MLGPNNVLFPAEEPFCKALDPPENILEFGDQFEVVVVPCSRQFLLQVQDQLPGLFGGFQESDRIVRGSAPFFRAPSNHDFINMFSQHEARLIR